MGIEESVCRSYKSTATEYPSPTRVVPVFLLSYSFLFPVRFPLLFLASI